MSDSSNGLNAHCCLIIIGLAALVTLIKKRQGAVMRDQKMSRERYGTTNSFTQKSSQKEGEYDTMRIVSVGHKSSTTIAALVNP